MEIQLDGQYYLRTDENNFVLQELKIKGKESKKEGDTYFITVGYYGNLQSALKSYLKYAIRNSTYGGREITTIQDLIVKIESIENKIDKALLRKVS